MHHLTFHTAKDKEGRHLPYENGGEWRAKANIFLMGPQLPSSVLKMGVTLTNDLPDRLNQCSGFSRPVDSQAVAVSVFKGFDSGRDLQHWIADGSQSKAAVGGTE